MDASKERILMCEKAEEIQKEWSPQNGDFFFTNKVYVWGYYECKKGIWLPRQDQLQEMMKENNIEKLHMKFNSFLYQEYNKLRLMKGQSTCSDITPFIIFTTMEQLWLAFVMKEKYNKIWNGKDWIRENS